MTPVVDMVRPRICTFPEGVGSAGSEAVDLARLAGLELDPWQAFVLEHSLAERPDGRWAAFEVKVTVSRQNGKGSILEARELAGLFLLGERLIVHSAHQFDTSLEAFRRLLFLIEGTPELESRVKRVSRSHGEEGVELKSGQRIRFRTRTKGGGRGFTADCLILDEDMILPEAALGAILPTLSARPNPQVWYTGSAVDQVIHEHGVVASRVRSRGIAGDPRLAYFEWSVDADSPADVEPGTAVDEGSWVAANPAVDVRISREHIAAEQRSMDPRTFAVERLGVGDWPATDPSAGAVIDVARWSALVDSASGITGPLWFAVDTSPDRSVTSITAAGTRPDGLLHVELVERRPGTGWVVDRMAELRERHHPAGVVVDGASPAASLADDLRAECVNSGVMVRACGFLFDAVADGRVRHLGHPEVLAALKGARKRPLGDAWAWSRKSSSVDITPLVGLTLAGFMAHSRSSSAFFVLA